MLYAEAKKVTLNYQNLKQVQVNYYLMDIEEKDQFNEFITGSSEQVPSVFNTVNRVADRNLDSSFAAAYYPDAW
jgi:Cu/Ag efflux protein CusF